VGKGTLPLSCILLRKIRKKNIKTNATKVAINIPGFPPVAAPTTIPIYKITPSKGIIERR
jgi:hypothetical protein